MDRTSVSCSKKLRLCKVYLISNTGRIYFDINFSQN